MDESYSVIKCTGYVKPWPVTNVSGSVAETVAEGETRHMHCLVAVGKVFPAMTDGGLSSLPPSHQQKDESKLLFISRHSVDGRFIMVDDE